MTERNRLKRAIQVMPEDVRNALRRHGLMDVYTARLAYKRNDYLVWLARAKRDVTRQNDWSRCCRNWRMGAST
jgi:uncharacterized protein YdeI (YjbR/CyaY-like superfamily)